MNIRGIVKAQGENKHMQKHLLGNVRRLARPRAAVLIVAVTLVGFGFNAMSPFVRADSIQSQINSLNSANAATQAQVNALQLQANSYDQVIAGLQSQINAIVNAIAASQAEEASLQNQIAQAEAELAQQKDVLATDIKMEYVNGGISTTEMLASSQSLSAFADSETYRSAVQDKIQATLDTINKLEATLKTEQAQVAEQLQTQKTDQTQLDSERSQEQGMLNYTNAQKASYNSQISSNNKQISELEAEQAAANASIARTAHVVGSSGGSGGLCDDGNGNGGYPMAWCNVAQDSITDANGFPARECTSYAYWYFTSVEHQTSFSVSGNAGWWYETSNFPITYMSDAKNSPSASEQDSWAMDNIKTGAIGIEPSSSLNAPVPSLHGGYYGHVMVVQALPGQNFPGYGVVPAGYMLVSSMNEDEEGHFQYNLWPINYLIYINPR